MDKILNKIPFYKSPFWFKLLLAKILIRTFKSGNMDNDIVLFNELNIWIKTKGRPLTSNPNYYINKY